jgi:hypothetical protein
MKILTLPKRITTPVKTMNPTLLRLERKRVSEGLSEEENRALDGIYSELERAVTEPSEQDVDAMAEREAEGRLFKHRHLNFHD